MAQIRTSFLSTSEVAALHDASLHILAHTGVMVHHDEILARLGEAGAQIERATKLARLPERLVMDSVARAGKQYILYGRDPQRQARLGYGDLVLMSIPGQFGWIDMDTWQRRAPTVADLHDEQPGQAVDVALAVAVVDVDALAAGDDRRSDASPVPGEVAPHVSIGLCAELGGQVLAGGRCHRVPQLYCCLTSLR